MVGGEGVALCIRCSHDARAAAVAVPSGSQVTVNALLGCLAKADRSADFRRVLQQLPELHITPDAQTLNYMVVVGVLEGDNELTDRAVGQLLREGHSLARRTLNVLLPSIASRGDDLLCLSLDHLELLNNVLHHARRHTANGKVRQHVNAGKHDEQQRGGARMHRLASDEATPMAVSADVMHDMIVRNTRNEGQRWRGLADLVALLVEEHGLLHC